jgi:membrane fusion protein (multidrug efflux system)
MLPRPVPDRFSAAAPVLLGALLVLSACSSGNGAADKNRSQAPPEAGFVVLATQTVPLTVELAGRTSAFETSEVRPQVSGVIQARLFTEGAIVKAGQTLYRIDPSLYEATVNQARADLASAKASSVAAVAKSERFKSLLDTAAVSKQDYADALATANQSTAAVARAEAALQTAQINLRFTNVPAPITGRIGRSLVTTGALVTAAQATALATIQRLDPIFVDIQQSSSELLALRRALASGGVVAASAHVHLTLEDGSAYPSTGELQFAESMVDESTGTVTLRARFSNPSALLLPGMYVRAQIVQSEARDAILAPQQGISRDAKGNATALVVGEGDKAEPRTVVASRTIGDKWLVTDGFHAGDKLIVEGLSRIKAGQVVKPVPAGSAPRQGPPGGAGGKPPGARPT